ncbi:hypothetical protein CF326_g7722, partial [Tilletia indica]
LVQPVHADPLAPKASAGPHDVTGVMGLCCRHDIPVVFCDITTPGEREYYAIALVNAVLTALRSRLRHAVVMYDLGCRYAFNPKVENALVPGVKVTWTIPLFHVYGHTSSCHISYSPRNCSGCAWSDGEGMERVWAGISGLIASTRAMSQGERRLALEERLQHLSLDRRRNLFVWFRRKRARIAALRHEYIPHLASVSKADLLCHLRTSDRATPTSDGAVDSGASTTPPIPTQSESSSGRDCSEVAIPSNTIPFNFVPAHIDPELFDILSYMCRLRRIYARQKISTPKKAAVQSNDRNRQDPVPIPHPQSVSVGHTPDLAQPQDNSRHTTAAASDAVPIATTVTGDPTRSKADLTLTLLANALFKCIAKVNLAQAQLKDRIGTRMIPGLRERFLISLATDTKNAVTAMNTLNAYLLSIKANVRTLKEATLYDSETASWISSVASSGSCTLPWWGQVRVAKILDAFDRLVRIAEEDRLLDFEAQQLRKWVVQRSEDVRARQDGYPQRLVLAQLEALRVRWEDATLRDEDSLLQTFDNLTFGAVDEDEFAAPSTEHDHVTVLV